MFALLRFEIKNNNKEIYKCEFSPTGKEKRKKALSTILIGENGSGKSYLLSQIADFLRFVEKTKNKEKKVQYKYSSATIEYFLNSDIFLISKDLNKVSVYINGVLSDLSDLKLPSKVIAMSFMVNDKFSFSKIDEDEFYDYRGVRATSNASYTSTIKRMITNSIIDILKYPDKINLLTNALKFLGMDEKIDITYELKRKTLFRRPVQQQRIKEIADNIILRKKYIKESELVLISKSPNIIENDVSMLHRASTRKKGKVHITVDLKENSNIDNTIFSSLGRLERVEFISSPDIHFYKTDNFSFEETSSGEKNVILTILNLVSCIKEDALVLIDEPEISLHPAWQMKYIDFVKNSIKSTPGCHIILASHSHFMVSDLEENSSSLVSIYQENNQRVCENIEYSTYAWSVEHILYKVFSLRTTRNSQVEIDLYELTSLVSNKSTDKSRVRQLVHSLEKITLDKNDPLNIIVSQGKAFLGDEN